MLDAHLARDRRQEPVHLAVEPQRLDDLRAEHLQRAAVVVQRTPVAHEISRLAIIDGSRRDRNGSLRSLRQPQTMS